MMEAKALDRRHVDTSDTWRRHCRINTHDRGRGTWRRPGPVHGTSQSAAIPRAGGPADSPKRSPRVRPTPREVRRRPTHDNARTVAFAGLSFRLERRELVAPAPT